MAPSESLEANLVHAGFDALREIGGQPLVEILLSQAGEMDLAQATGEGRVPLEQYLRYRDAALDFLQESFSSVAFQTGTILVQMLKEKRRQQISFLLDQYKHAANKLPLIGQAAVLAAKGNPGSVQAKMKGKDVLLITIENCPECRGLTRETPFCYLNQGIITEFAASYVNWEVVTNETRCMALGHPRCEIEVVAQK